MAHARISRPFQSTGRARAAGMAPGLASLLGLWLRRRRNRRAIASLTVEQMRDTGLDPEWVRRESGKPFWRR
jgi:uncharacterized protein YjiS (DUF1127 family)